MCVCMYIYMYFSMIHHLLVYLFIYYYYYCYYYYYRLQVAVNSCELLSQARQHQHCPGFSEVDPTARPLQCHSNQRTSRDCDRPESSQLPKPVMDG